MNGDLFILPSETESFGLAALEAMAAGMPVISSNSGGLPEVNQNGYSGFISDVGNTTEMTNNALKLLESKELMTKFKKQALLQAEKFSLPQILPNYIELYNKLLLPLE
jgi:glycosyltransferase involved in cell wall biosynthesis